MSRQKREQLFRSQSACWSPCLACRSCYARIGSCGVVPLGVAPSIGVIVAMIVGRNVVCLCVKSYSWGYVLNESLVCLIMKLLPSLLLKSVGGACKAFLRWNVLRPAAANLTWSSAPRANC